MSETKIEKIRVVIFSEDDQWVAQCLEYDICVQAGDLDDIPGRLSVAVRLEEEAHQGDLSKIGKAPKHFFALWDRSSGTYQPRLVDPGYELAICA